MTVLVTGSSGKIGRAVVRRLEAQGRPHRTFDVADGDDLRDELAVRSAAAGCTAVVHAGALAHDTAGSPSAIMATNVLGTWHVLEGAERAGTVERVVVFSSMQVFGFAEGEHGGAPEYVPVDDAHPRRASRPYGLSKVLVEDVCAGWTDRTGIPTVVLRPSMVLDADELATRPDLAATPHVHLEDVVDAVIAALDVDLPDPHVRASLAATGDVDVSAARRALGWRAVRGQAPSG